MSDYTPTTEEVLTFTAQVEKCPHCYGEDVYLLPVTKKYGEWLVDKRSEKYLKASSIHDRTCRRFRMEVPIDVIDKEKFLGGENK